MKRKKVDIIWLCSSIFSFLVLAVSFLLMPLESESPSDRLSIYSLVVGIVFWLSLMTGIVTQCVLAYRRRVWYGFHRIRRSRATQRIGLISFFKNPYAIVADIIGIVSLIGLIVAAIVTQGTGYICYVFVSLFVFFFSMHCVLNGKIFYYIINQRKILDATEKEREKVSSSERKE